MHSNPENQFKQFLIAIIVVVGIIVCVSIKPSFFKDLRNSHGVELSSEKPWQEDFDDDEIDDVDIEFTQVENEFKKEESNNPFKFKRENDDDFWITGSVPINPMSDFNNKTKAEIYSLRKELVEKTIFKNRSYKPSDAVFGQIADNKPWLGIDALTCSGKGANANKGLSEESRYINNPTMLIGLDRVNFDDKPKNLCSVVDYLMPVKINYLKDENIINIEFEVSSYKGDLGKEFLLKGLNAKDLGFKYAYADKTENLAFLQPDTNISTDIKEFKDVIKLGNACGVNGGCNNGSPFQKELNFTVMKYPATIHFKLWKKLPKNKDMKADINYFIMLK